MQDWERSLTRVGVLQALQVPPDGLRDGYLGDDVANHRAKEGLQIHVLSCQFQSSYTRTLCFSLSLYRIPY